MAKISERFNLVGRVFSELTVLEMHPESRKTKSAISRQWICQCSCGKQAVVASHHLKNGNTKSCGHLNHETGPKKPGKFREKVRAARDKAIHRCYNDAYVATESYKGRGVKMSDEFLNSFECFYEYIGDPPTKKHTLERIDVNKGYERGNLMWQTIEKQARNKTKLRSNTSGVTGVSFNVTNGFTRVVASWRVLTPNSNGKVFKNKYFSVNKYGLLPAFAEAVKYRQLMIEQLNEQGAGYSDNHGLDKVIIQS